MPGFERSAGTFCARALGAAREAGVGLRAAFDPGAL